VTVLEGLNARDLTLEHLAEPPGIITADVSFISLKLALAPALALAAPGAWLVALVKPQFEAGPPISRRTGSCAIRPCRTRCAATSQAGWKPPWAGG
jgi:23S rRNA (cytidine1920-2'-O)/16S rRNA (cytidine1409-2'-O)-methyltransferase